MVMDGMPKWGPVHRGRSQETRPQMGVARENPRARIEREAREAQARAQDQRDMGREEVQDPWEARRQELAERGDIFDEQGNITEEGEAVLRKAGWSNEQMIHMERMQKNHVGEVRVMQGASRTSRQEGRVSSVDRMKKLTEARQRAQEELDERGKSEQEARWSEGERRMEGVRAFSEVYRRTGSEVEARRAQERAERQYDLKKASKRAV
ncbi:hypothetical protein EBT31_20315 [bacterium]|nr:hypothetical protein [bacterium]NBX50279.1 hypothetical protein [bacterium]